MAARREPEQGGSSRSDPEALHRYLTEQVTGHHGVTLKAMCQRLKITDKTFKARNRTGALPHVKALIRVVKDLQGSYWNDDTAAGIERAAGLAPVAASVATGAHVVPDTDFISAFIHHRHTTLLAEGLTPGAADGSRHQHFVNLELRAPVDEDPAQRDPDKGRFARLDALLASQAGPWVWVLLGDPGGGKSTLLFMHELQCTRNCLLPAEATQVLCIRVMLSSYDATAQAALDPAHWLDQQIQQQCPPTLQPAPTLAALDHRFKVRVVLDGLNEIAGDEPQRHAAQARFIKWALKRAALPGQAAPVFSVRRLDYQMPPGLGDGGRWVALVDVRPWRPDQIEAYCQQNVPGLWPQIDSHDFRGALIEHLSNPFNLRLQEWLFKHSNLLAANRAELLGQVARLRLQDELRKGTPTLRHEGLLTRDDQRMLISGQPAAPWHQLPLQGALLADLAALALSLHQRDDNVWALFKPAAREPRFAVAVRFQPCIDAARALAIVIERQNRDSFQHQLWQEYFAATALAHLRDDDKAWPPLDAPAQGEIDLAKSWALPAARALHLEPCVQLAAQIAPDPVPLIQHLSTVNPAMASRSLRSLGSQGDALGAERQTLRERLLQRSTDLAVPLPQRVEAGEELGWLGDNIRFEERRGPNGDRCLLPRATWQVNGRTCPGWVAVPAGRQVLGERNQVKANILPGLALAFAPVTNAEFECFVKAGGYGGAPDTPPPEWWQGAAALAWWRGEAEGLGQKRAFEFIRDKWLNGGRQDPEAFRLRWHTAVHPDAFRDEIQQPLLDLDDEAWARELARRTAARVWREPEWWDTPRFTHPLQPVVGINAFEAAAYCRWLGEQTGQVYRLPLEPEWEAAVRQGRADRPWPWGPQDPDPLQHMNHEPTRLRRTAPVGCFPAGQTAEGLTDAAGQVWQWMANDWGSAKAEAASNTTVSTGDEPDIERSVRGGSWYVDATLARPFVRYSFIPGNRSSGLGFRLLSCPILGP